jgi:hypothetical protein
MRSPKSRQYSHLPDRLFKIISSEFKHDPLALALFDEFLPARSYSRSFALKLIGVAKRSAGASWEIRRLAALMLENQVLKLPLDRTDEFDFLLVQLGLKSSSGESHRLNNFVLKEGYTTTELRPFVAEFRRRLAKLDRVHDQMAAGRTSQSAVQDFINLARCDCKISLARYFFKPKEVVEQILKQLRTSRGVPDLEYKQPAYIDREIAQTLDALPAYEAGILRELRKAPIIYWVSETTSAELNSLVEYPLTTVVLVIKPPGSDLEFEIKRAGRRRGPAISVVYRRNGRTIPPPHRFDGGSMLSLLRNETGSPSMLSTVYRLVHAKAAPMSRIVMRSSIYGVPSRGAEANIIEYFTYPHLFGHGFREMRAAMKDAVKAFNAQDRSSELKIPGELGLTIQFINHATPGQAILSGSSSFRINKVERYLSEGGPDLYFRQGLKRDYSWRDAKRLADEVLEEALGVYAPPAVRYRSHSQYVAEAFRVAANRARADQVFSDLIRQMGTFWGTLLAIRGFSWGESFVPRNVGLRSVWRDGEWKVELIFMDHDCLNVVDKSSRDFNSRHAYHGMSADARFIGGDLVKVKPRQNVLHFLQEIYRIPRNTDGDGKRLLYRSIQKAYSRTHEAMATNAELRKLFHKVFLERIRDWDALVSSYLQVRSLSNGTGVKLWKEYAKRYLKERRYGPGLIASHLKAIEKYAGFLEKQSFLYRPGIFS